MLEIIAMLSMLIDHVGVGFFPENGYFRLVGRLAFPLYAFALVQGYKFTRSKKAYLLRLFFLAAISQVPYKNYFNDGHFNVIFTLLFSLVILIGLDRFKGWACRIGIIILGAAVAEIFKFSYGAYAVALVLIYRYLQTYKIFILHLLLNFIYLPAFGYVQFFSMFANLFFVSNLTKRVKLPRFIYRSFYPVHLIILSLLSQHKM